MRDALYHDASPFEAQDTAEDVKYMWDSWTQDTGKHFSLDRGARIAAELLHSWLLRSVTASRPFAHPALRRARSLYGKAPSAGTCFSFDDTFGGAIAEPQVVSIRVRVRVRVRVRARAPSPNPNPNPNRRS